LVKLFRGADLICDSLVVSNVLGYARIAHSPHLKCQTAWRPTANATLTGIKHKVENKHQYEEYLEDLKGVREELGINLKEDLYPEGQESPYFNP
jgi:hypothetical protein